MALDLRNLLERVASGEESPEAAEKLLSSWGFVALGHQRIDIHRSRRGVVPEVVLAERKSIEQLHEIVSFYRQESLALLVTRIDEEKALALSAGFGGLTHHPRARALTLGTASNHAKGTVAVISAGSSDESVAEEAALTLEFFGAAARRAYDCGVAGLHRLLAAGEDIASADVIIAVAGMEGALPSVVAGLFPRLVIAVPTSVGYGASFGGIAALLAMMNSCAPGVVVVNIDNGFGAAVAAIAALRVSQDDPSLRSG